MKKLLICFICLITMINIVNADVPTTYPNYDSNIYNYFYEYEYIPGEYAFIITTRECKVVDNSIVASYDLKCSMTTYDGTVWKSFGASNNKSANESISINVANKISRANYDIKDDNGNVFFSVPKPPTPLAQSAESIPAFVGKNLIPVVGVGILTISSMLLLVLLKRLYGFF